MSSTREIISLNFNVIRLTEFAKNFLVVSRDQVPTDLWARTDIQDSPRVRRQICIESGNISYSAYRSGQGEPPFRRTIVVAISVSRLGLRLNKMPHYVANVSFNRLETAN
jgi:hypothetical protein